MQSYSVTAHSSADPSIVYGLLLDGKTWPSWMGVDAVDTKRKDGENRSPGDADTVGDVRRIQTGRYVNYEQIVELVPERKFSYVILDGMLHDYRGDVTLAPLFNGGTKIEWQGSFRMSIPGAAWLMRLYLSRFMQRAVSGLARHAAAAAHGADSHR